ncbi:hypothetical protein [Hydrogenobaculum acidophilum]
MEENFFMEDCFVAYLDVLGTTEFVRSITTNQERFKRLIEVFKINPKFTNEKEPSKHGKLSIRSFYFSDSFAFIMKEEEHNLPHLLLILRYLQDKFWEIDFCLRGAVTIGKMYWPNEEEKILFGEGIIEAHKLEEEIAIYPRIVISDKLYKYIKKNDIEGYPFTEKGYRLLDAIVQNQDVYFLDLLDKKVLRRFDEKIEEKGEYFSITWSSNKSSLEQIIRHVEDIVDENLKRKKTRRKAKTKI